MALTERDKVAHLLRRFGLGASEEEVNYYMQGGLKGAIDKLLNCEQVPELYDFSWDVIQDQKGQIRPQQAVVGWSARILMTRRPLLEKMTHFWHNHFATSAEKVTNGPLMIQQNDILRRNALGNFKTLLSEVAKDPAMLIWLDGQDNIKGRANENFGREVMELFTLGVGNYTEKDIQEAARAFTGWSFVRNGRNAQKSPATFMFKPVLHDDGTKTVLGKTGDLSGDDVLGILCSKPRVAEFITNKIWNWFVYPNADPATLKPFVDDFWRSGLDIKTLIRAIVESDEFYSDRAHRKLIKNPLDFCMASARAMGVGEAMAQQLASLGQSDTGARARLAPAAAVSASMKSQGMWLLYPPDVSGWKPGDAWISSATMVERINWANKVMGGAKGGINRYPIYTILAGDPSPMGIATKLASMYDVAFSENKMQYLADAATKSLNGQELSQKNANTVAADVLRLIFGSPEFQFC
ncbi:MAG: DUF1800 domain-containing protein [Armatimonadetes bacterium]|nr:DUF1800 family protein [Armatimonadota bacterium]MBS1701030.1 DUF1800 domain-containing protein [Armatimonadota bacterium]MBS1727885.1 DUF1800 domain-containing protein [Armatimonadota bacterium]